ncbi:cation diffusion facilitator family transporter [Marinilabilia salmonicolor]|jgi:cobalt-zinc-cadmium efflux system protein|uniref:Cobalt-zinc-cadmium efflux system protein n=1 Tax=Marinilabilia salmonicolor TaxID=989 RepID=A0A368UXL9_9BACT|nr:cation diffusion facilitator family transporter [Marinilabilia salmonicolor]RCW31631.1 cobalt-zinc-cadmium efflux system protein [Marinilabilia salmonicolor]
MSHSHQHITSGRAFAIGITLNLVFVGVEVFYGLVANSSALLADAGHNASDVLGLFFAWGAFRLANRKPKGKYTYGLQRSTILSSILNAVLLFIAVFFIAKDAIFKLGNPVPVGGTSVMIVAGIGVVINTITALLFVKGQKNDLNIKGAFLHMAADAAVSLGVVVAGFLIQKTGYQWIDPVVSFVIIAVVLYGTWGLFVDSINLALDAVPKNIDIAEVRKALNSWPGVDDAHDLHVWALSTNQTAVSVHLVVPEGGGDQFLADVQQMLDERFNISHATIQVETNVDNGIECNHV